MVRKFLDNQISKKSHQYYLPHITINNDFNIKQWYKLYNKPTKEREEPPVVPGWRKIILLVAKCNFAVAGRNPRHLAELDGG